MKHERSNDLIKFQITETPKKPLDIYSVHKENFLTILDKFSKFGSVFILESKNSISLINCLKHYFSHHGVPTKIISDNAHESISTIFQDFLKM